MRSLRKLNRLMNEEGEYEYVPTRRRRSGVPAKELESFFVRKYKQAMSDMMQSRRSLQIHDDDLPMEQSKIVPKELLDYIGRHPDEWKHVMNKKYHESTVLIFRVAPRNRPSLDPILFEDGEYGFDIYVEFSLFDIERILVVCYQKGNIYYDEDDSGVELANVHVEMGLEGFDRSPRFIGTLEDMIDDYIGDRNPD